MAPAWAMLLRGSRLDAPPLSEADLTAENEGVNRLLLGRVVALPAQEAGTSAPESDKEQLSRLRRDWWVPGGLAWLDLLLTVCLSLVLQVQGGQAGRVEVLQA